MPKARLYVAMVSCVETGCSLSDPRSRAEPVRNVNNIGFGVYLYHIKLNSIIVGSDLVILDFDLLIFGSNIVL